MSVSVTVCVVVDIRTNAMIMLPAVLAEVKGTANDVTLVVVGVFWPEFD